MRVFSWQRTLIVVLVPVVALGALIGVVLLPRALGARRALAEARTTFFETAERIRGLGALRERLARVKPEDVGSFFIEAERPLQFIETLETLAERTASTIEITFLEAPAVLPKTPRRSAGEDATAEDHAAGRAAPEVKAPAAAERGFGVRLRGTFRGALTFLAALENQPKVLRVDEVTSQATQEGGEAVPRMSTAIRFYAATP